MNEIKLSSDIKRIELEINHHKNIAGQSIWEIGRRLNHVKENDLTHGQFIQWVEDNLNISIRNARRFMRVSSELPKGTALSDLGIATLDLIASLPEVDREKVHLTESGELKKPEEMTTRELERLNKQVREQERLIKEQEAALKQKDEAIEYITDQEPRVEYVEKRVEVTPPDYDNLKSDNQQLSQALKDSQSSFRNVKERNDYVERQYEELRSAREEMDMKALEYEMLQENVAKLQGRMTQEQESLSAQKKIAELISASNQILTHLAPITYLDDFEKIKQDAYVMEEMKKVVTRLSHLTADLSKMMERAEVIEGEFIND